MDELYEVLTTAYNKMTFAVGIFFIFLSVFLFFAIHFETSCGQTPHLGHRGEINCLSPYKAIRRGWEPNDKPINKADVAIGSIDAVLGVCNADNNHAGIVFLNIILRGQFFKFQIRFSFIVCFYFLGVCCCLQIDIIFRKKEIKSMNRSVP
jgi:hypothetical protein